MKLIPIQALLNGHARKNNLVLMSFVFPPDLSMETFAMNILDAISNVAVLECFTLSQIVVNCFKKATSGGAINNIFFNLGNLVAPVRDVRTTWSANIDL